MRSETALLSLVLTLIPQWLRAEEVTPHLHLLSGPVNSAVIADGDSTVVVYGTRDSLHVDHLLLTHHRRDVVTSALHAINSAGHVYAPEAERDAFEKPHEWWAAFSEKRFHDYAQQSTKVLANPVRIDACLMFKVWNVH